jgi:phosphoglycerol transferase MdoB-like AlkP superfamily enzyme
LISILSGYPAQTKGSIIKYSDKAQKLPHLSRELEKLGYQTSFVYGGDADFANFRSYLTNAGFGHITADEDFSSDLNNSKWGVNDQYIFEQSSKELDSTSSQQPFFKVILTLSSHEPFDVPMTTIKGNDEPSLFLNSCYYTDHYLGEFIKLCKQKTWWDNTLVIITADHGHRLPDKIDARVKERFHIPLLVLGGAIKKDSVIQTIGSQTDIANTILAQVAKPSADFRFSKDLFGNNVQDFAVYLFNDGYGYVDKGKYILYDNQGKLYLRQEGVEREEDKYFGKAYVQQLYSDYNAKK